MSRFKKQNKNNIADEIMTVLEKDYAGNILYYKQAEKDVLSKFNLLNKLHSLDKFKCIPLISDTNNKMTYIDLKNNEIGLVGEPDVLLAYNLDYLGYRRILPFTLNTFINKEKTKDLGKSRGSDYQTTLDIINWAQDRILNVNFTVTSISLDRNNGVFKYTSSMREREEGSYYQYITCKIDLNKYYIIDGVKKKAGDWMKDYATLFAYFITIGCEEIYCRCNCGDYQTKYSKRVGPANFMCRHLLYSMSQMPYYLYYTV